MNTETNRLNPKTPAHVEPKTPHVPADAPKTAQRAEPKDAK